MKIVTYVLMAIAFAMVIFNLTMIDYSQLSHEKNFVAFIGVFAAICAILILLIFRLTSILTEKIKS